MNFIQEYRAKASAFQGNLLRVLRMRISILGDVLVRSTKTTMLLSILYDSDGSIKETY
jgi:hypothetical protein